MKQAELFTMHVGMMGIDMIHEYKNYTYGDSATTAETNSDNVTLNALQSLVAPPPFLQFEFHNGKKMKDDATADVNNEITTTQMNFLV